MIEEEVDDEESGRRRWGKLKMEKQRGAESRR